MTNALSWEQTVEDFGAELHLCPRLRALSHFRHLFLRVDRNGLIHLRSAGFKERASSRLSGRLYFAPYRDDAKCEFSSTGLIKVLKQKDRTTLEGALEAEARECGLVCAPIPDFVLAQPLPGEPAPTKRWRIVNQSLENSPVHRINVAVAIVQAGLDKVLNKPWRKDGPSDTHDLWESLTRVEVWNPRDRAPDFVTLAPGIRPAMPPEPGHGLPEIEDKKRTHQGFTLSVPLVKFNNLVAAEREQIETLCSIENLIRVYKADNRHDKPLSIAVFAPPGAGKSFAVKENAASIEYGDDDIIEFNVSQFRNPADLTQAFRDIERISKPNKPPPLAFFDEFNSTLDKQELGWLRYFLAPMQDGIFYDNENKTHPVQKINRCILVFAGGIHTSFEEFDPRTSAPAEDLGHKISEEYRKEIWEFEQSKGPDFISRLRGHINIADANAQPGRSKHFLRRAVQLRGLLENKLKPVEFDSARAKIDEAVIYALLTIDRYHHGVRSMEAILRMCAPIALNDNHIYISSVPARAQLNMHVDADEFAIQIRRGRARAAKFAAKPAVA